MDYAKHLATVANPDRRYELGVEEAAHQMRQAHYRATEMLDTIEQEPQRAAQIGLQARDLLAQASADYQAELARLIAERYPGSVEGVE